ncbi:MAG: hypothetical protein IJU96_10920 [Clostridia bacterium]|nr:hypothetical protein [Clostridia bacterium]
MKQTAKTLIALLLVLLLAFTAVPAAFAADDDVIATGTGGEGITWTLTEGGVLTVSGNGPIVDDVNVEIDEEGYESSEMLDCIGWQLDSVLEARTANMTAAEAARARFDLVKELVIAEGITAIPSDEFSDFYPRSITLPGTLKEIGYSAVNASFAETLTMQSKDLVILGGTIIAGHKKDAATYASIDEAIAATVAYETQLDEIEKKTYAVYDLGAAYEMQCGIDNGLTEEEYLANFNEYYGTDFTTLDECIAFCIDRINSDFGTQYTAVDEVYTFVQTEDESYAQRDEELDNTITELYEAADIEDSLCRAYLGEEGQEDVAVYTWLTVYGPAGSGAEEAAATSGVPFEATTAPDTPITTFFGRIKRAYETVKAFVIRLYNWIRFNLAILK